MKKRKFRYNGAQIRAIVLDVDDTLVKTQEVFEICCETLAANHGKDPQRVRSYLSDIKHGKQKPVMPLESMMHHVYPEIGLEEAARWVSIYQTIALSHTYVPIHDALRFLDACMNQVHLGFCSNELTEIAVHRLKTAKLNPNHYFPAFTRRGLSIQNGKTVGFKKPEREALQYFVEKFNIEPHELLMIGDMKTDYEVAKNAGTHGAIVLSNIFSRKMMEEITGNQQHVFDSLTHLLEYLSV